MTPPISDHVSSVIFIPIAREIYDDIIMYSKGKVDPIELVNSLVMYWLEDNLDLIDEGGEYWEELAQKYAPSAYKEWKKRDGKSKKEDLIWKEITVPHGSEVRMVYNGNAYYARVYNGYIVDEDGNHYSPSQWANHVANGTTRNAWRDLSFKEPLSRYWVPAMVLRQQARKKWGYDKKEEAMATTYEVRWVDDIYEALVNLGGKAPLDKIYREVERIRKKAGRSLPKHLEATIRRTLEDHSSDSANFKGIDLFRRVERGVWALRY